MSESKAKRKAAIEQRVENGVVKLTPRTVLRLHELYCRALGCAAAAQAAQAEWFAALSAVADSLGFEEPVAQLDVQFLAGTLGLQQKAKTTDPSRPEEPTSEDS